MTLGFLGLWQFPRRCHYISQPKPSDPVQSPQQTPDVLRVPRFFGTRVHRSQRPKKEPAERIRRPRQVLAPNEALKKVKKSGSWRAREELRLYKEAKWESSVRPQPPTPDTIRVLTRRPSGHRSCMHCGKSSEGQKNAFNVWDRWRDLWVSVDGRSVITLLTLRKLCHSDQGTYRYRNGQEGKVCEQPGCETTNPIRWMERDGRDLCLPCFYTEEDWSYITRRVAEVEDQINSGVLGPVPGDVVRTCVFGCETSSQWNKWTTGPKKSDWWVSNDRVSE